MYVRALNTDPKCVSALCSMGTLMQDNRQDFQSASQMYMRALDVNPEHVTTLCNYGTLLHDAMNVRGPSPLGV
jgi:Tfp pilus assembly protein PilF